MRRTGIHASLVYDASVGECGENANFLQQWIAQADFDGSEYGTDVLQIHKGDMVEQWQTMPDGWAFGRIRRYGSLASSSIASRGGSVIGLFLVLASFEM